VQTFNKSMTGLLPVLAAVAFLASAYDTVLAQNNYPSRLIKIIVPVPAGTPADTIPRIVAAKLAARWGQAVIVENRPGAGQTLGAEAVAKAAPDGYTLLAAPPPALVTSQDFYPQLGFNPSAFVPVTVIAETAHVLVVHQKIQMSNVQELIAFAKAHPDELNYASAGNGGIPHLAMEQLKILAGIRIVHVPYKGLAPATTDLLAGHVDMMFDNLGNSLPYIKNGKFRALAVSSERRIPELPGVPAMSELFPGFVATSWFAVVAPPKTPPEIADKLSQAIAETLRLPDVAQRLHDLSHTPVGGSPAETAAFLKRETERWHQVIVSAGIKAD
jgi:tripartite-type tricarboxylate transporter receptor subunit TctC